jgi:hypothetical protein
MFFHPCKKCGTPFPTTPEQVGKPIKCLGCGHVQDVPAERARAAASSSGSKRATPLSPEGTAADRRAFRAEDVALGRTVALKVIKPGKDGEQGRQRLLREARSLAALEHEHVVVIHQVGEDRGVPFVVMPLLKDEALNHQDAPKPALAPFDAAKPHQAAWAKHLKRAVLGQGRAFSRSMSRALP